MNPDAFRALRSDAGVAPLTEHFVARVRGSDSLTFLHSTTTQDLLGLESGQGALTCLLDDKGHVLAEMRALVFHNGDVLLDGETAIREAVTDWLARIAPLSGCEVIDESDEWTCTAIRGPRAATAIGKVTSLGGTTSLPAMEHHHTDHDGLIFIRVEWGIPGFDLLRHADANPLLINAPAIDETTFEAERIAAGRPRFGLDVTPDLIVNETPLLSQAVSFTKGCFPGQETVARIRNLGRARRAVVALRLENHVSRPGAVVRANGQELGTVTSAGRTPEGAVALATIRSEIEDGTTVSVENHAAELRALS